MARPRQAIPQLHYHSASGQFRVNVPGGKPKYFGRDEGEAQRLYKIWAAEYLLSQTEGNGRPAGGSLSVAECCLAYWDHAEGYYGPGGHLDRVGVAIDLLEGLYGPARAADFGAKALKAYRQHALGLPNRLRPEQTLSRNYVNSLVRAVKTAWVWLESEELVPRGASQHLKSVKALLEGDGGLETPPVLPVEPWVVEATLPHLTPTVRAMVRVHQLVGMRPGELCRMRRCDLSCSPDERLEPVKGLTVSALAVDGATVWLYCPASHKTKRKGKHRVIAIGPQAQELLAPFLAGRGVVDYLFSPLESLRQSNTARALARRSRPGKRRPPRTRRRVSPHYSTETYAGAVTHAVEKANRALLAEAEAQGRPPASVRPVPHWSPNQLRHHVATEIRERADLATAADVLGHSDPATTLIYALQSVKKAAAIMAKIG